MANKESLNFRQFCSYVVKIASSLGVLPSLSKVRFDEYRIAFGEKRYGRVVSKVLGDMRMQTKIGVNFIEDSLILKHFRETFSEQCQFPFMDGFVDGMIGGIYASTGLISINVSSNITDKTSKR